VEFHFVMYKSVLWHCWL